MTTQHINIIHSLNEANQLEKGPGACEELKLKTKPVSPFAKRAMTPNESNSQSILLPSRKSAIKNAQMLSTLKNESVSSVISKTRPTTPS